MGITKIKDILDDELIKEYDNTIKEYHNMEEEYLEKLKDYNNLKSKINCLELELSSRFKTIEEMNNDDKGKYYLMPLCLSSKILLVDNEIVNVAFEGKLNHGN